MIPEACVIYEPPRKELPYLVVMFSKGRDPRAQAFWSLTEAKSCLRAVSMRALETDDGDG